MNEFEELESVVDYRFDDTDRLMNQVIETLTHVRGWVTNDDLCRSAGLRPGNTEDGGRMREIINRIRRADLVPCVIAGSRGYKIATSRKETIEYLRRFKHRINAQQEVFDSISRQMAERF